MYLLNVAQDTKMSKTRRGVTVTVGVKLLRVIKICVSVTAVPIFSLEGQVLGLGLHGAVVPCQNLDRQN